jgi:HAE1 family hydrophobic/amphiphilic exporter-1
MLATGAGANGNHSIGTGAVGGMLVGTTLGVFITPVLFIIFQSLQEKISGPPKKDFGEETDVTDHPSDLAGKHVNEFMPKKVL